MGDGGRAGAHAFALALPLAAQVEVEARAGDGIDPLDGPRAQGEEGEAGRQGEGLLAADHDHVQAPGLRLEGHGPRAGDGVHHEEHALAARHDAAEGLDVVTHAGGRLGMLHEHRTDARLVVEGRRHGIGTDGLAPGSLEDRHLTAVGPTDVRPSLAEASGHTREHVLARPQQVDDRRFHGARSGRSEDQGFSAGLQEALQASAALAEERLELLAAVMRDVPPQRLANTR